ncbi:ABC transporter substrate-binding protein [Nonomuraea ferruginea]
MEKGETQISIDWDYNNAAYAPQMAAKGLDWQVNVPSDGQYFQMYAQAINKDAPHPAAARLWQEFLYSPEGQNLYLKGFARPVLMPAMQADGSIDKAAAEALLDRRGRAGVPDHGAGRRGQEQAGERLGRRDLRMRRSPGWLGTLPLLAFYAFVFGIPLAALLAGAFTSRGEPTLANVRQSLEGGNLTAMAGSVQVSAVVALSGGPCSARSSPTRWSPPGPPRCATRC